MGAQNTDRPPTFNWTDEEKALLRRTLRVRTFEADRIEIETLDPRQVAGRFATWTFLAPALATAALAVAFGTSVSPHGLVVPTWLFAAVPVIGFLMVLGMPRGLVKRSEPVTLFAGTPWCVRHRQPQGCLEILQRSVVETDKLTWRTVPLNTDIGPLFLSVARRAPLAVRLRVRQIILDRCASVTPGADPPEQVVQLVGPEVARLPRVFYVALQQEFDVVSVTPERLKVSSGCPTSHLLTGLVLITEILLLLVFPLFLPALGAWPDSIAMGTPQSAWVWRLVLFAALIAPGPIHVAADDWRVRRSRNATLTFSKDSTFVAVSDRRGQRQLSSKECRFTLDEWDDSDNSFSLMTLSLHHGEELLGRWSFCEDKPPSGRRRALEKGLHEYLRSGSLQRDSTERLMENAR
jgi:hypothetical protein